MEWNPGAAVLVAEAADNARLGFISMRVVDDLVTGHERSHVADPAVATAARRSGVGRALMTAGEAQARDRGVEIVTWGRNRPRPESHTVRWIGAAIDTPRHRCLTPAAGCRDG